jgi:hypothetical protein
MTTFVKIGWAFEEQVQKRFKRALRNGLDLTQLKANLTIFGIRKKSFVTFCVARHRKKEISFVSS